jgi:hypothetical protein
MRWSDTHPHTGPVQTELSREIVVKLIEEWAMSGMLIPKLSALFEKSVFGKIII